MNPILIANLLFYIAPYLALGLYDLSPYISETIRGGIFLFFGLVVGGMVLYSYPNRLLFAGFMPAYLLLFYSLCWIFVCMIVMTQYKRIHLYSCVKALSLSFLIVYIGSFFWEIPENIYWLIQRGWHPATLFHLLGAFPYIMLDGKRKWKRTKATLLLVSLVWIATSLGILIFIPVMETLYLNSSWLPKLQPISLYFLGCRFLGIAVLTILFVWGSWQEFWGWFLLRAVAVLALIWVGLLFFYFKLRGWGDPTYV